MRGVPIKSQMILLGLFGTIVILVLVFTGVRSRTTGILKLTVVPQDAQVTVDGTKHKPGTIRLSPGSHTIVMKRDGFTDLSDKLTITQGKTLKKVYTLEPSDQKGFDWQKNNPDLTLQGQKLDEETTIKRGDAIADRYPFTKSLPFVDPEFRIDYGVSKKHPDDTTALAFYIRSNTPEGRDAGLRLFKFFAGGDVSNYEIYIIDTSKSP